MSRKHIWPPRVYPHQGQDRIRWKGRDIYLGPQGSAEARAAYIAAVAQIEKTGMYAGKVVAGAVVTIEQLVAWWNIWAPSNYRPDSSEHVKFRCVTEPLRSMFGSLPATEFRPRHLKELRKHFCERWCRKTVNRQVGRVKTLFRRAADEGDLIPGSVWADLRSVRALMPGTPGTREVAPQTGTTWEIVERVIAGCPPAVAAMLAVHWHTGMRSGEVRRIRGCDIEHIAPDLWKYQPPKHKTAWLGNVRAVPMGPAAIAALLPWQRADPQAYLFTPRQNAARLFTQRRSVRVKPIVPSDAKRDERDARHRARLSDEPYSICAYAKAVRRAADAIGVDLHPYQCRHSFKRRGLRIGNKAAVQAAMGQKSSAAFDLYDGLDWEAAAELARKIG